MSGKSPNRGYPGSNHDWGERWQYDEPPVRCDSCREAIPAQAGHVVVSDHLAVVFCLGCTTRRCLHKRLWPDCSEPGCDLLGHDHRVVDRPRAAGLLRSAKWG